MHVMIYDNHWRFALSGFWMGTSVADIQEESVNDFLPLEATDSIRGSRVTFPVSFFS
jgi:hypothetical protein